ncbi:MAG: NfeD family protein, partial [Pirellulales bacterium]
ARATSRAWPRTPCGRKAIVSEEMGWLLLLIGGAALVFELQTPGIGLGGFVATVAFVVYFWAQYLRGTRGSLEVMLFLDGLFTLAMEIFVLPGLGVLGLGGGLLMVAALVLASQSFILPANEYQIRQLEWSLLGLLGAAIGVAVIAVLMRRWLPFIPGLREVIAVGDGAAGQVETTDGVLDGSVLPSPGGTGTTTTRLAPAGKAMIDGRLYDVASDGPLVEPGVSVTVVSVRGSRILVRADAP